MKSCHISNGLNTGKRLRRKSQESGAYTEVAGPRYDPKLAYSLYGIVLDFFHRKLAQGTYQSPPPASRRPAIRVLPAGYANNHRKTREKLTIATDSSDETGLLRLVAQVVIDGLAIIRPEPVVEVSRQIESGTSEACVC